jgi:tetratricopeptide (TPR) repeat protein
LKQKHRRLRNLLLILIAVASVGGGTFIVISRVMSARRSDTLEIEDLLSQADYDISLGYYRRALESLEKARGAGRGEYNTLRILKRVYQISYDLDDFSFLRSYARSAADRIPGSTELQQIYLYAAIRASAEGSQRAVERLKRSRGDSAYLQAEAYFSGLLDKPPDTDSDPELKQIMSLVAETDPFQLQRLGTELDEKAIDLDAALLWMGKGDVESAFTVINRHIGDPLFREPSIYISYDAGREQTAMSVIREARTQGWLTGRTDLQIMEADLHLILGDSGEATGLYRQVIAADPAYSWTPYLNLAVIAERKGDAQSAYALQERAYRQFPSTGAVVMTYARSLMKIGDRELAAQILQQYLVDHADDYQAQLVLLDAQNTASSPVLYQAALWKLYNRHPDSRMLCEYLFLYLMEFNDLSGAESVLGHYQAATGRNQEPWLLEYRAILSAVRRENTEAVRLLEQSLSMEDSWQGRFNLAVLLGKAGRPEEAIEQLIEAEHLLPDQGNLSERSRIRSGIGEQYLILGDEAAARRECEYAIDLDLSNFHAHRILRILERE